MKHRSMVWPALFSVVVLACGKSGRTVDVAESADDESVAFDPNYEASIVGPDIVCQSGPDNLRSEPCGSDAGEVDPDPESSADSSVGDAGDGGDQDGVGGGNDTSPDASLDAGGVEHECVLACIEAIAVVNSGFENPTLTDNAFTPNTIVGWIGSDPGADHNFGVYNPPTSYFPAQAPEGLNTAYIERGDIHQVLGHALELNSTYKLSARLGDSLVDPTPTYSVQFRSAGRVLAALREAPLINGEFVDISLEYRTKATDPIGSPLEIWFVELLPDKSSELYIDSVVISVSR